MKLTFKETIEKEMEIEVPCYRTNGTFIVKVIGECESLMVEADGGGFSRRNSKYFGSDEYFTGRYKESTREDFDTALDKFKSMFNNQDVKHFQELQTKETV